MWSTVSLIALVQMYLLGADVVAARETIVEREGYTTVTGVGSYKLTHRQVQWNEARSLCEQDDAHLVIINSNAEAREVARLLNSEGVHATHVGVHDIFKEGEFVTIFGVPLDQTGFMDWNHGEPSNSWRKGAHENCVEMTVHTKLNDIGCQLYRSFVCELLHVHE